MEKEEPISSKMENENETVNSSQTNIGNEIITNGETFSIFKNFYDSSKCYVSLGLSADEAGNKEMAIKHYLEGLKCLEEGTGMASDRLNDEELSAALRMQSEMLPILQRVRTRLYELEENIPAEQASTLSFTDSSASDASFEDSHIFASQIIQESDCANADEMLKIPHGVQLFTVDENFAVSAAPPSYPNCLTVYHFDNAQQASTPTRPPAFLRVGDWVYPLLPGCSPVLHCTNGAYVFPNVSTNTSKSRSRNVGIVLSADLDPVYEEMFRNILSNMASLQKQERRMDGEPDIDLRRTVPFPRKDMDKPSQKEHKTTSAKLASGIETGADWISRGLSKGADLTVKVIKKSASGLQSRMTPNKRPTNVNPAIEKGLQFTHQASMASVVVSSALVKGLCVVANEVAKGLSQQIKPALPSPEPGSTSRSQGVMVVASAGVQGLGTLWNSLEESGLAIAKSMSSATSETVQHKYGEKAGKSAGLAMNTAVNCARTVFYLDNLGLKAVAKKTARKTGKEVLKDYSRKTLSKTNLSTTIVQPNDPSTSKQDKSSPNLKKK